MLQTIILAGIIVVVRIEAGLRHTVHARLWVLLSWVVWHALWVGEMCLLVHRGRCHGRTARLAVGRALLVHALGLESWGHATAHLLMGQGTVGLR